MFEVLIRLFCRSSGVSAAKTVKKMCRQAGLHCSTTRWVPGIGPSTCRDCGAAYHFFAIDGRPYLQVFCSGCGRFLWRSHTDRFGDVFSCVREQISARQEHLSLGPDRTSIPG